MKNNSCNAADNTCFLTENSCNLVNYNCYLTNYNTDGVGKIINYLFIINVLEVKKDKSKII